MDNFCPYFALWKAPFSFHIALWTAFSYCPNAISSFSQIHRPYDFYEKYILSSPPSREKDPRRSVMKFSCEKALLSTAVSTASRAVSPKSSIPAMEGILIEAGSVLRLTGYNLETGIQATVPAEIREKGSLVLSARLFSEIVRKMPDDILTFSSNGYNVNIKCGLSEFNILGTDPEEFPELPSVDQQNALTLKQPVLRSMIGQTLFAVSDNESRPVHTGSLFDVEGNTLTVVSVDGYRLALRRETVEEKHGVENFSFVVPGSALSEVEKICSSEEKVTITQGARHIMFQAGDILLVCRRLEGEFLPYKSAIPRNNTTIIQADSRTLLSCLDRVSLIISEKLKSPLRCVFGDGMLSVSTKTAIGDAADQCPIEGNGGGLEIGFNNKYLMDAIKAAPADKLRLEFTSGVAPCVILPAEGEETFIYMVLPVRLKAN